MKPKKCKICGNKFEPKQPLQEVCSMGCAIILGKKRLEKQNDKKKAEEKKVLKEKLKTKGDWHKEAQTIFNTYIRKRDANETCISCKTLLNSKFDAGHYISVGHSNLLRYDEKNVHGQCVHCNQHKHGNIVDYRIGLIKRIGIEEVERLERIRNDEYKHSVNELIVIIELYKRKIKNYEIQRIH